MRINEYQKRLITEIEEAIESENMSIIEIIGILDVIKSKFHNEYRLSVVETAVMDVWGE